LKIERDKVIEAREKNYKWDQEMLKPDKVGRVEMNHEVLVPQVGIAHPEGQNRRGARGIWSNEQKN
jgi:hypothetical protein